MILTVKQPAAGDYLVAQAADYECLVFSGAGDAYDYDVDHAKFDGRGRYKPRNGDMPATEAELRVEFFTITKTRVLASAKLVRDAAKVAELNGFDFDATAQANIEGAINSFDAVAAKAVELGHAVANTIPWVKADNSVVNVTLQDLKDLRDAGAARALELHLVYNAKRAELEALIEPAI